MRGLNSTGMTGTVCGRSGVTAAMTEDMTTDDNRFLNVLYPLKTTLSGRFYYN
jgi:hypothetical protein